MGWDQERWEEHEKPLLAMAITVAHAVVFSGKGQHCWQKRGYLEKFAGAQKVCWEMKYEILHTCVVEKEEEGRELRRHVRYKGLWDYCWRTIDQTVFMESKTTSGQKYYR